MRIADPSNELCVVEIARPVGSDTRRRAGKLDELADLSIAVRGQRHDRNTADFLECEIEVSKLDDVGKLNDDPVERSESFVQQVQSQTRGALVELGIGHLPVAVDDRHAIGVSGRYLREGIAQEIGRASCRERGENAGGRGTYK